MTKKEFMCFSLNSRLFIQRPDHTTILELHGIVGTLCCHVENGELTYSSFNGCTPICRNLSDLTKEIEHNGEKFIPIIELAKIALPNKQGYYNLTEIKDKSVFNGLWVCLGHGYYFKYTEFCNSFDCIKFNGIIPDYNCHIPNQLQLFQKLISWHFNLMDESEEFTDVNTLEINPYK